MSCSARVGLSILIYNNKNNKTLSSKYPLFKVKEGICLLLSFFFLKLLLKQMDMKIASGQEEGFKEGIRNYIEVTNAAPGCLR